MPETTHPLETLRDPIATAIDETFTSVEDFNADAAAEAVLAVLDDAVLERVTDQLMAETRIRSMDFRRGVHMELEPARDLAAIWVACARTMLGDAPNYTETKVEFDVGLGVDSDNPKPKEIYTLVVQRAGKLTPHDARQRAEEALRQQTARLSDVIDEFGHDPDRALQIIEEMLTGVKEQEQ